MSVHEPAVGAGSGPGDAFHGLDPGGGPRTFLASTGDGVRPAAYGLAVVYLVVALPPNLLLPPGTLRTVLCVTMLAGAAACAVLGRSAERRHRPPWLSLHRLAAGLAAVPAATSLVTLVAHGRPFQTVNLMLTLIGAGALIHVRRVAVAVAVSVVAGWLAAGLLLVPAVLTTDTVTGMAMAAVLASILHVTRQRTVVRLEAARQAITAMAVTDELTGLANRRALLDRGSILVEAGHRGRQDVTVLYLDVDGLKAVNDTQGHAAGDALIVAAAERLRQVFRTADLLARTGGDEFAVVLCGCGPRETALLRERLEVALRRAGVSASCGAAHLLAGEPAATLEQLLDRADLAMYGEKRSRRSRLPLPRAHPPG